ncbi:MAG: DUF1553 domain-containing protein [Chitinophagaceae bacterium]|nr:DUF1553 domain-containing protein [Chitinophagaceae bacterium]
MKSFFSKKLFLVFAALSVAAIIFISSTYHDTIDFNTEVKPIFNDKCISCHGGVKRKAGFSLLFRSEAMANTESGKPAIIPGKPDQSELIRRITLNDPEERMPYKHEPLSKKEIEILRQWIKQGATWGDHWAYMPVKQTEIPEPNSPWIKNGIDHFIAEKLNKEKIKPSIEADKASLLRRVSLDITGMPASPKLASLFLTNTSENAYRQLVDSLLASPGFGERWTAMWLDLARYADTKGYERDDSRTIWRYRDWLITAFNEDKPYDQFLTEQIAGDLLPDPTDAQYIATAFHRNTMTNDEGGTDNEEYRTSAVLDRVNTTWEVLMGTSFACVQCHSHPYDPFKHDEYYKFVAFFNDTRDEDTYEEYPVIRHFPDSLEEELNSLNSWLRQNASAEKASDILRFVKTWEPSIHSLTADQFVNSELSDTKWLVFRNKGTARLKKVNLENKDRVFIRYRTGLKEGVLKIHLDRPDGMVLKTVSIKPTKGWAIEEFEFPIGTGMHDLYLSYTNPNLKKPGDNGILFDWFHFAEQFPGKERPGYSSSQRAFQKLLKTNVPNTPIMMENPGEMHRETNVFERGNWLMKGKVVQPETPHVLNAFPANVPRNRLGLAKWLTDPKNPLTARTMVNRLWEQFFGAGLVETLEDMGTQGAIPSHKELLDWMSWKFMGDFQWSVKKMIKEIVMSATYRQSSKADSTLIANDPYNKLYARGPGVRLNAEQLRDQALMLSGLLSKTMYGPSVMPPQPEGIWQSPYNGNDWKNSNGEDKYRRAVYTYYKRTAPYPSMISFDGAIREICTSRRIRTNTPLQALVTLNDEAYLEMARAFAYRMKKEAGKNVRDQISRGYEIAMYKKISATKLNVLEKLYADALTKFSKDKDKTCEMIGFISEHNNPETAALVVVANAMLNLDEMISKN